MLPETWRKLAFREENVVETETERKRSYLRPFSFLEPKNRFLRNDSFHTTISEETIVRFWENSSRCPSFPGIFLKFVERLMNGEWIWWVANRLQLKCEIYWRLGVEEGYLPPVRLHQNLKPCLYLRYSFEVLLLPFIPCFGWAPVEQKKRAEKLRHKATVFRFCFRLSISALAKFPIKQNIYSREIEKSAGAVIPVWRAERLLLLVYQVATFSNDSEELVGILQSNI